MKRALLVLLFLALFLATTASLAAADQPRLTILKAGPTGEVASLAEVDEIRVVFSEPMVVVGRIPKTLEIPLVSRRSATEGNVPLVRNDDADFHTRSRSPSSVRHPIRRND